MTEGRVRVLIADADAAVVAWLVEALHGRFGLSVVDNPMDLFKLAVGSETPFDLIITDVEMDLIPRMDMPVRLRDLKVSSPIITPALDPALPTPEATRLVAKPYEAEPLAAAIQELLAAANSES